MTQNDCYGIMDLVNKKEKKEQTYMGEKIRFGIVGCGGIARWHASAVQKIEKAKLAAVADSSAEQSEKWGKMYNVPWFADLGDMLGADIVDAVCICTPSGFHAQLAKQALLADKHVVVEKPMAITPDSMAQLLRAEEKSRAKICVISQLRFSPDIIEAKKYIDEGAIGKIVLADLSMKYYREPSYYKDSGWRGTIAMDGGALMNQGIHGVDLLRFLCGDIREIYARSATLVHNIEAEDTLSAAFLLESGGMGVMTVATSAYPGHKMRLEICGTEGSIILEEDRLILAETKSGVKIKRDGGGKCGASNPFDIDFDLHLRQIDSFVEVLSSGGPFEPGAKEAAKTLAVIFAVHDSRKSGSSTAVKQFLYE